VCVGAWASAPSHAMRQRRHLDECRHRLSPWQRPRGMRATTAGAGRAEVGAPVVRLISAVPCRAAAATAARTCRRPRFRHVAIHYAHVAVGINMIDLRRRRRRRRPSVAAESVRLLSAARSLLNARQRTSLRPRYPKYSSLVALLRLPANRLLRKTVNTCCNRLLQLSL